VSRTYGKLGYVRATVPTYRSRARRRLRQLPDAGRVAHRVAVHPAGRLVPDGCRSDLPAPLPLRPTCGLDPLCLDAQVMCILGDLDGDWSAPSGLTFRAWLQGVPKLRPPTLADLDYHLSTLFPPVRPRGWLELRRPTRRTATTGSCRLRRPRRSERHGGRRCRLRGNRAALPGLAAARPFWLRAARTGLDNQDLAKAARACSAAADSALAVPGTPAVLRHVLTDFAERYTERGRSPALDHLDALRRT
jgi:hypothetical protein